MQYVKSHQLVYIKPNHPPTVEHLNDFINFVPQNDPCQAIFYHL